MSKPTVASLSQQLEAALARIEQLETRIEQLEQVPKPQITAANPKTRPCDRPGFAQHQAEIEDLRARMKAGELSGQEFAAHATALEKAWREAHH